MLHLPRIFLVARATPASFAVSRNFAGTVDPKEIEQFRQLASEWWDKAGPTAPLHDMNELRVPFIRDGILKQTNNVTKEHVDTVAPLKGLSILDVGCGGGILSEALAKLGANVTGIDANVSLIDVAKYHAEKNNILINYESTTVEDHAMKNSEKYDAVVASEVIEHIPDKEQFLAGCAECLKPSGTMVVTTLNKTFMTSLYAIFALEYVFNRIPKGTHEIEKCIEPHRVQQMLEKHNIQTKLINGAFFNGFTKKWSWSSSTSIFYALLALKSK